MSNLSTPSSKLRNAVHPHNAIPQQERHYIGSSATYGKRGTQVAEIQHKLEKVKK